MAASCIVQAPSPFELAAGRLALRSDDLTAASPALHFAAQRLREAGLVRHWRSEQLDVRAPDGRVIATIERAACRALGIATRSVHLNGFRADGSLCAARRAMHKPSDPGRWDNLAGGMVAAGEDDARALAREAHEEAGLQLAGLSVARGSELPVRSCPTTMSRVTWMGKSPASIAGRSNRHWTVSSAAISRWKLRSPRSMGCSVPS